MECWGFVPIYPTNPNAVTLITLNNLTGINILSDGTSSSWINDGGWREVKSNNPVPLNQWFHIAVVMNDNGRSKVYINGVKDGDIAAVGNFTPCVGISLASNHQASNNYSRISMSEMRIWTVARTANEINFNYNRTVATDYPGLEIYYKFNQGIPNGNNAGITTLTDHAQPTRSTRYNGTLVNFALSGATSNYVTSGFVLGVSGPTPSNALRFDGINDYIDFGANITEMGKASFTIECWVKTSGTAMGLLNCQNTNASWDAGEKSLYIDENGIPAFVGYGNNWIYSTVAVNDNAWHHIAVTWSYSSGTSGTGAFYIDGINRTLTTYTTYPMYTAVNTNFGTFTFGKPNYTTWPYPITNFFNGSVSELRIWNVARTETEIRFNYNKEVASNSAGLKAYYKFKQGVENGNNAGLTTLTDSTTNAFSGTLVGFGLSGTNSNYVTSGFVLGESSPTPSPTPTPTPTPTQTPSPTPTPTPTPTQTPSPTPTPTPTPTITPTPTPTPPNTISLNPNGVTVTYIGNASDVPTSSALFIQANPRETGMEWFAVVKDGMKSAISEYASGTNGPFIPSGQSVPVPFNNIVTTLMTDLSSTFLSNSSFNQPISSWDTANVNNMAVTFRSASNFNQPIDSWNTANVLRMNEMFFNTNFNQPIGSWNTAKVTNMYGMFQYARMFNQPINHNTVTNSWNTANVINMGTMFDTTPFNTPINLWNTAKVANMAYMFRNASIFNQPIGSWNTIGVGYMENMFENATNFNQPINTWTVVNVSHYASFRTGSALSYENTPPKFR